MGLKTLAEWDESNATRHARKSQRFTDDGSKSEKNVFVHAQSDVFGRLKDHKAPNAASAANGEALGVGSPDDLRSATAALFTLSSHAGQVSEWPRQCSVARV